jgi:ABC-2 type transport system ATP-binding protein
VDPASLRNFWRLIRSLADQGTTLFVTTHYMDEAEYCARVGLMVAGRLAALDTPAGLKATHTPGDVRVLRGPGTVDAAPRLRALPGVIDVTPMGAALRVRSRLGADLSDAALAVALAEPVDIEPDIATLEDVFLAVVDAESQRAGTARALGEGG